MIKTVTITGADDSIDEIRLVDLQNEFPFVEWGILVSRKQYGNFRFPSIDWIDDLVDQHEHLRLSMHLCGAFVREFLQGNFRFQNEVKRLFDAVSRIQINTHGEPHQTVPKSIIDFMCSHPTKEFIFQYDNANTNFIHEVLAETTNGSVLFDLSHGTGLLPNQWPKPIAGIKCGYAGGLSPDNLAEQIRSIENLVADTPIWIDMETHVRSNMDSQFDLNKVRKCLEISAGFLKRG